MKKLHRITYDQIQFIPLYIIHKFTQEKNSKNVIYLPYLNDLVVNGLKTKNGISAPRAHVQTPEDYHHRPTKASN